MTVHRRVVFAMAFASALVAGVPGLALAESETPVAGEYAAEDWRSSEGGRSHGDTNLYVTLAGEAESDASPDTSVQTRMLVSVPASDSNGAAATTAAAVCSSAGLALGALVLSGRKG